MRLTSPISVFAMFLCCVFAIVFFQTDNLVISVRVVFLVAVVVLIFFVISELMIRAKIAKAMRAEEEGISLEEPVRSVNCQRVEVHEMYVDRCTDVRTFNEILTIVRLQNDREKTRIVLTISREPVQKFSLADRE